MVYYCVFRQSNICLCDAVSLGLDMCIGRWDNGDHCLTDVGEIHLPVQTLPDGGVTAVSYCIILDLCICQTTW